MSSVSLLAAALAALSGGQALAPGGSRVLQLARSLPVAQGIHAAEAVTRAVEKASSVIPEIVFAPVVLAQSPSTFGSFRPLATAFASTSHAPAAMVAAVEPPAPTPSQNAGAGTVAEAAAPGPQALAMADDVDDAIPAPPIAAAASPLVTAQVPVPVSRPLDLDGPVVRTPLRAARHPVVVARATQTPSSDNRSFLERFFGLSDQKSAGPALGYAAPESTFFSTLHAATGNPARGYGDGTAVYEIATHTVFMPDGTRLEAHSGLGNRLDDPRFVRERMRGPTPPHTYALTMRESLFHGVQALRLNPIGDGGVFGRTGLLAHTFMLGPNGDSNGCVSFRNYRAFLQAFQNGDVRRLVVVARLS